jgi:uroporphyrinogen decarboxylase
MPVWVSKHSAVNFDESASEMAKREIQFQKTFDWDLARVAPAAALYTIDWGCRYTGTNHLGVPTCTAYSVTHKDEWEKIVKLDVAAGYYGRIASAGKILAEKIGGQKPILATGFSPLTLALKLAGKDILLQSIHERSETLHAALRNIAETMIEFIHRSVDFSANGLYFASQSASYDLITKEEYKTFEEPYNLMVLEAVRSRVKLLILHLHGDGVMFDSFVNYSVDIFHWADRRTKPSFSLAEGRRLFPRSLMGGLNGRTTLCGSSVNEVKKEIGDAYSQMNYSPFILSPCCVIPVVGVPDLNLYAIKEYVESKPLR